MRVISGSLKGRQFNSTRGHRTHPMADKIRGALFSALGDVEGLTFFDAFTGTGAIAIEAVSRGAASVLAIDIDKDAYNAASANVESLNLKDKITVMRKNVRGWSRNNQDKQFDIVVADPPYDDFDPRLLQRLTVHVKPEGLFILSWPGSEPIREWDGLSKVTDKQYGDAQLIFYRKNIA